MRTPDFKHELRVYQGVFARKGHKKEVTSEKGPKRLKYCNYWGIGGEKGILVAKLSGKICAPKIGRELQDEDGVYVFKKELCYQIKIKLDKNSLYSTSSPKN